MTKGKAEFRKTRFVFPRTLEDLPFFPFTNVRMKKRENAVSSVEEAQYDFVKQAGHPSNPETDAESDR
jgi:hypothetical protein